MPVALVQKHLSLLGRLSQQIWPTIKVQVIKAWAGQDRIDTKDLISFVI